MWQCWRSLINRCHILRYPSLSFVKTWKQYSGGGEWIFTFWIHFASKITFWMFPCFPQQCDFSEKVLVVVSYQRCKLDTLSLFISDYYPITFAEWQYVCITVFSPYRGTYASWEKMPVKCKWGHFEEVSPLLGLSNRGRWQLCCCQKRFLCRVETNGWNFFVSHITAGISFNEL